ncbi:ATP-grasp domain-containing protein [Streptomyces longisporus]|uniref:ATP-grasp domain-containing protein n=1 Tax=Streptomyces longisporus TaxID=1948 RepID=A0ABP6AVN8_STRLO
MTGQRMQPRRLLVTGVGGAPGLDLALELLRRGHEVIGVDADPLAPGLLAPGIIARVTTRADDPRYGEHLLALCRELKPHGMIPIVEHELPALIPLQEDLARLGVRTWLPGLETARAAIDKALFHEVLHEHGIPVPKTFLPETLHQAPDGPLVVKPRHGQGAKGIVFCDTRQQARMLCDLVADPIIQETVTGREFSADCLVDRSGRPSVVLRERLIVKGGLSMVARTFHDDEAVQLVRATLAAVGAVGPNDVQGFITDASGGPRVVITEINARFAGGFALSEAAGADLVQQTLNGLFDLPVDHDRLAAKPDVYLSKYVTVLAHGPAPYHPTGGTT